MISGLEKECKYAFPVGWVVQSVVLGSSYLIQGQLIDQENHERLGWIGIPGLLLANTLHTLF